MEYYLSPYLHALVVELDQVHPDVNFIAAVFFALEQAVGQPGRRVFDGPQRALLVEIANHVITVALSDERKRFDIGGEHIIDTRRLPAWLYPSAGSDCFLVCPPARFSGTLTEAS